MEKKLTTYAMETTLGRAIVFLGAISTNAGLRRLMKSVGYDDAEQDHGWELVANVKASPRTAEANTYDREAKEAMLEVDAADELLFRRAHAALQHLHPEQHSVVFADLAPGKGAAAVAALSTFLDRIEELEASDEEGDRAAVATLAKRGMDASLREKLRQRIEIAKGAVFDAELEPQEPELVERERELQKLQAWYKDWAETARTVVTRRDHLLLLGLAHRKRRSPSAPEPGDTEAMAPPAAVDASATASPAENARSATEAAGVNAHGASKASFDTLEDEVSQVQPSPVLDAKAVGNR